MIKELTIATAGLVTFSAKCKADLKKCAKRGRSKKDFYDTVEKILAGTLERGNKDREWIGNCRGITGCRECHINSDWLLVYRRDGEKIYLISTGSHSDFRI